MRDEFIHIEEDDRDNLYRKAGYEPFVLDDYTDENQEDDLAEQMVNWAEQPATVNLDLRDGDIGDRIEYPEEFKDVVKVLEFGATKYEANSWLEGIHFNKKDNDASIGRHWAKMVAGEEVDEESGLDHRLHAACRLLMSYTLFKRGLSD